MKTCNLVVPWEYGIHVRPATKIVHLLKTMDVEAYFVIKNKKYNAKKAMELLFMEAYYGDNLLFEAIGNDALDAVKKITLLFSTSDEENYLGTY